MARARRGEGQTALITGASGGIGLELAECFAKDGYDLVLSARSAEALERAAKRLSEAHSIKAVPIAGDLQDIGAGAKLAETIAAQGLGVDVLVNNAGFGAAGAFAKSDAAAQLGMVDLNMRALVELTHIYWPGMLKAGRGGVINVASTAAFQPGPFMAVYYATKAFVVSFTEALWEEARGTGVHVSALCPGPTATGFAARAGTDKTRVSKMGTRMSAKSVARIGYRAFQNDRRVVVAGARNAFLAGLAPFLPRKRLLKIVRGMQTVVE